MIWEGLSFHGLSEIIVTSGNQYTRCFQNAFGGGLLPFVANKFGESHPWVCQQDNASIHTAIVDT